MEVSQFLVHSIHNKHSSGGLIAVDNRRHTQLTAAVKSEEKRIQSAELESSSLRRTRSLPDKTHRSKSAALPRVSRNSSVRTKPQPSARTRRVNIVTDGLASAMPDSSALSHEPPQMNPSAKPRLPPTEYTKGSRNRATTPRNFNLDQYPETTRRHEAFTGEVEYNYSPVTRRSTSDRRGSPHHSTRHHRDRSPRARESPGAEDDTQFVDSTLTSISHAQSDRHRIRMEQREKIKEEILKRRVDTPVNTESRVVEETVAITQGPVSPRPKPRRIKEKQHVVPDELVKFTVHCPTVEKEHAQYTKSHAVTHGTHPKEPGSPSPAREKSPKKAMCGTCGLGRKKPKSIGEHERSEAPPIRPRSQTRKLETRSVTESARDESPGTKVYSQLPDDASEEFCLQAGPITDSKAHRKYDTATETNRKQIVSEHKTGQARTQKHENDGHSTVVDDKSSRGCFSVAAMNYVSAFNNELLSMLMNESSKEQN
ncbi:unnamed protein product [Echinostoma caproni]|uniref:ULP_PROTEASE domain-containing protein n=1 Tax=Echinostoma caproni TaxID=27848 RepID=A0A183A6R3_9TREM|nr:unnamed protein product [Echinostoma caproni]